MTTSIRVREQASEAHAPIEQKLMLPGELEKIQAVRASSKFIRPVGTHWVENDVLGVAEEVNRRWPNLRVASCPCGHCLRRGHYPHMVMEHCRDGVTRPIFGVTKLNRSVVDRLKAIHESNDPKAHHEELKRRHRAEAKRKRDEAQREQMEVIEAALKSPKSDWRGPGGFRTNPYARAM